MNYNVRIDDNFLRGDHVDGEVLQHSDLNELENVAKTAINANYEDIQKLQDGTITISNSEKLDGASLSKFATETLQNSDTKVPTSSQVKNYVDGAIGNIDLDGYYTKREIDETLENYPTFTDYATASKGGVIKSGYYGLQVDGTNGKAYCDTYTYANYGNVENQRFISKGTLENVITGKGLINNTVDNLVNYYTKTQTDTALSAKADTSSLATVATSGSYNDLSNKPAINNGKLTIQKNGTTVNTFNANSSTDVTANITVPTKTTDLTNDSGFITNSDLPDLTDYVKKTDYPTNSKPGVVYAGNEFTASNGVPSAGMKTYSKYLSSPSSIFISKYTLENVITGKDLTTKSYVDGLVGDIGSVLDAINGEVI